MGIQENEGRDLSKTVRKQKNYGMNAKNQNRTIVDLVYYYY